MQRRGGEENYESHSSSQAATSSSYSTANVAEDEYTEAPSGIHHPSGTARGRGRSTIYIPGQRGTTGTQSTSSTAAASFLSSFHLGGFQQEVPVYPPNAAGGGYGPAAAAQAGPSTELSLHAQSRSRSDPQETCRERRRQQNKLAQRALRRRKEIQLRELETRLINARLATRHLESENRQISAQLFDLERQNFALRRSMGLRYPPEAYSPIAGPSSAPLTGLPQQLGQEEHGEEEPYAASEDLPSSAPPSFSMQGSSWGPHPRAASEPCPEPLVWSWNEFLDPAMVWESSVRHQQQQQVGLSRQQLQARQWSEEEAQPWGERKEGLEGEPAEDQDDDDDDDEDDEGDGDGDGDDDDEGNGREQQGGEGRRWYEQHDFGQAGPSRPRRPQ